MAEERLRKRIISQNPDRALGGTPEWLDLGALAEVEVSSEDPAHPVEHALLPHYADGWRAGERGPQLLRILFDEPQTLHRIYLHFEEATVARTQEIRVSWAETTSAQREEVVRQQWNFSPTGSTHEIEDYRPTPRRVAYLELEIVPDLSGGEARASLQQLRLA